MSLILEVLSKSEGKINFGDRAVNYRSLGSQSQKSFECKTFNRLLAGYLCLPICTRSCLYPP